MTEFGAMMMPVMFRYLVTPKSLAWMYDHGLADGQDLAQLPTVVA